MDTKTILTIIGSFMAASTAQIISHILTLKREKKNYQKACYQHLYSPTIFKLTDYIRSEAIPHYDLFGFEDLDIPSTDTFHDVMTSIGNNLKYADVDVINFYHVWQRDYSEPDTSIEYNSPGTFDKEAEIDFRITFANSFFSQFIQINKALKFNHKIITEELKAPYFFTHFFLLIKECTRPYSITYDELFAMYDLIEAILSPINDYTERIISVRNELDNVYSTPLYKNNERVAEAYLSAYGFLYEIVNEFADISEDRANKFKKFLDSSIKND
ncbi:hypothetical protein COC59_29870 [Bacillus cereus]|nr:hypothetical protein COC59_29870 [Bacillus cereus]